MTDTPFPTSSGGPFALSGDGFSRMLTLADIAELFAVSQNTARSMLADPSAPPALPLPGRVRRWNPQQVLVWAHGGDWRQQPVAPARPMGPAGLVDLTAHEADATDPEPRRSRPGTPWSGPTSPASSLSTAPRARRSR
ncbi:MAG: hypothetical protein M3Q27_18390 [Actinomycetota bacterium]|nr:hypothetical protein [Actinomycetota bacterium]